MKLKFLNYFFNSLKNLIKIYLLPYKPLKRSVDDWEDEFASGRWNYLEDRKQIARYNLFAGYNSYYFHGQGAILDLGCGQGILLQILKNQNYKSYVGLDISQTAIDLASQNRDDNVMLQGKSYKC